MLKGGGCRSEGILRLYISYNIGEQSPSPPTFVAPSPFFVPKKNTDIANETLFFYSLLVLLCVTILFSALTTTSNGLITKHVLYVYEC